MPIIILVGMPGVGKSSRAAEIKHELIEKYQKSVHIISENVIMKSKNYNKNDVFRDANKEKEIRSTVKSEVLRLLSRDLVVIMDAINHIKGYRYEMYCATKNRGTTQAVIEIACPFDLATSRNSERLPEDKYDDEVLQTLRRSYEAPDPNNRWDSPMFLIEESQTIPWDDVANALFHSKPPPPNQSTQCPPLASSDFLHDLDRVTQDIVKEILDIQQFGGNRVKVGETTIEWTKATPAQMGKLRRQFLNYTRLHPPSANSSPQHLALLFAQFLSSAIQPS